MTQEPTLAARTPLERVLQSPETLRPSPLRVFELARQRFMHSQRLDMGELATEAGISRATLNRWVGSRERLLGEILYSVADSAFTQAERSAAGRGAPRVLAILEAFFRGVLQSGPYRTFVEQNTDLALSLCTSKQGPVQQRLITRIEDLLAAENVEPDGDMARRDLAYALLRIGESFVYNDVITGEEPKVDAAVAIWKRILS